MMARDRIHNSKDCCVQGEDALRGPEQLFSAGRAYKKFTDRLLRKQ